jgi:hypothetical protein
LILTIKAQRHKDISDFRLRSEGDIYFLFSISSQIANAAVTMHAGTLIHIGISTALAVTFT